MTNHYEQAESDLRASDSEQNTVEWSHVFAQQATTHAILALVDAVREFAGQDEKNKLRLAKLMGYEGPKPTTIGPSPGDVAKRLYETYAAGSAGSMVAWSDLYLAERARWIVLAAEVQKIVGEELE